MNETTLIMMRRSQLLEYYSGGGDIIFSNEVGEGGSLRRISTGSSLTPSKRSLLELVARAKKSPDAS